MVLILLVVVVAVVLVVVGEQHAEELIQLQVQSYPVHAVMLLVGLFQVSLDQPASRLIGPAGLAVTA